MKKLYALILLTSILLSLCACKSAGSPTQPAKPDPTGRQISHKASMAWVNWNEDPKIISEAFNSDLCVQSGHMPIYRISSEQELSSFCTSFQDTFCWEQRYDEIRSANEILEKYDSAFFENNTLLLVYVSSSSGSLRYAVEKVVCSVDNNLTVYVKQMNHPETVTCDMAGWLCAVEVSKEDSQDCTGYDAVRG